VSILGVLLSVTFYAPLWSEVPHTTAFINFFHLAPDSPAFAVSWSLLLADATPSLSNLRLQLLSTPVGSSAPSSSKTSPSVRSTISVSTLWSRAILTLIHQDDNIFYIGEEEATN
jgi:hypothetical protein